jgi:hypothetical protein
VAQQRSGLAQSRPALPIALVRPGERQPRAGDDRCRPHNASHTAAALDEHGRLLDRQQRLPATLDGYQQLRQWAGQWQERRWAVEGAHGIGRALAQRLSATAPRRNRTANRAAALLSEVAPTGAPAVTRWQLATELVADVRHLVAIEARSKTVVAQSQTGLVQLFGVGLVLAATFPGGVGDVGRFPSKHHVAAHTGTAPLEASSGQVVRHRLSRAGDRKLNHARYMMAMVQVRRPSAGQAYYRRQLAEGKSPKGSTVAVLQRRLSDAVYRCLVADRRRTPETTGPA